MRHFSLYALLLLIPLIALGLWWSFASESPPTSMSSTDVNSLEAPSPDAPQLIAPLTEAQRTPQAEEFSNAHPEADHVDQAEPAAHEPADLPPTESTGMTWRVHGILRNLEGRALPEVSVALASTSLMPLKQSGHALPEYSLEQVTARDGSFDFAVPSAVRTAKLHVSDEDWVEVRVESLGQFDPVAAVLLYAAPLRAVAGQVLRPDGSAARGGNVYFRLPRDLGGLWPAGHYPSNRERVGLRGQFEWERLPDLEGCSVLYSSNVGSAAASLPSGSIDSLLIQLKEHSPEVLGILRGRVIDLAGHPIQNANVQLYNDKTRSDSAGRFELEIKKGTSAKTHLVAWTRETHPLGACAGSALESWSQMRLREPSEWRADIVLRPMLSVQGRLTWDDGEPVGKAPIELTDGAVRTGAMVPQTTIEALVSRQTKVETDREGHFSIALQQGVQYRVRTQLESAALDIDCGTLFGGPAEQALVIPRDAIRPQWQVELVDLEGMGIANAKVQVQRILERGGPGAKTLQSQTQRTNAAGIARFKNIARSDVDLHVELPGGRMLKHQIQDSPEDTLRIVVYPRRIVHTRLSTDRPGPCFVQLLNQQGQPITFQCIFSNGGYWFGEEFPLGGAYQEMRLHTDTRAHSILLKLPEGTHLQRPLPPANDLDTTLITF